ncbi:MAG: flagellar motor protein MotB [Acidobacteriaceae bacterium]
MPPKTIILVKKDKGHAGHHGGAWKVAYADFVTAMMALFIVLWLMNTNASVRKAVAGYFNDPLGRSTLTGTDRSGSGENLPITKDNIKHLKERLEKSIHQLNDLKSLSNQTEITVTPEGLRIELLETRDGSFFDTGSAVLNARGREILTLLAQQLSTVPNRISIEGHTDAQPYVGPNAAHYGNWELSTDRANAARRLMQDKGLRPNQVSQVRGYAAEQLRVPSNPLDPSNRRISLIVQYLNAAPNPESEEIPSGSAADKVAAPEPTANGSAEAITPRAKPSAPVPLAARKAKPPASVGFVSGFASGFASRLLNSGLMRKMRGR